jgi:hypothetical protein
MGNPTTARYPVYLTAPVTLDTAWELTAHSLVSGEPRNVTLRRVIEAGLAALSPSYKEHHAEES